MFKFNNVTVACIAVGILSGCSSQPTMTAQKENSSVLAPVTNDIVNEAEQLEAERVAQEAKIEQEREKAQAYLSSAVPMSKEKFNALVQNVPEQDEFESYRDLFDSYVTKNQELYFIDAKLDQWNKNFMNENNGYYSISVPISELTRNTSTYEASNSFGKKVLVERIIAHQDKISLDKSYIATTKEKGKALKGKTVRVYYTLAKSKDYGLRYIDRPESFCSPLQISEPTITSPQEIIMSGCELQANVVKSVILDSNETIKLVKTW